jgi:hypothetical protein
VEFLVFGLHDLRGFRDIKVIMSSMVGDIPRTIEDFGLHNNINIQSIR